MRVPDDVAMDRLPALEVFPSPVQHPVSVDDGLRREPLRRRLWLAPGPVAGYRGAGSVNGDVAGPRQLGRLTFGCDCQYSNIRELMSGLEPEPVGLLPLSR